MITARAARETAARKISTETYWVGRVDRKIRHAAEDGSTSTVVKFYQKLPDGLGERLLEVTLEHGFDALLAHDDLDNLTMTISWETK